jgi:D-alanyl-D-alanine-carboxypeptidase/D-alanyl-D-alanine-endopeptidase
MVTESIQRHFARIIRRIPGIVVAVVHNGETVVTSLGSCQTQADPASLCWEIGSITKVLTGVLLAEMSIRGEVGLADPIGRYLPDSVARRLPPPERQPTLMDLATHTAGLPRLPFGMVRGVGRSDDPYSTLDEDDVFRYLGPRTRKPRRPRSRYSNFGMGLLGHVLARAGGSTYAALLDERVMAPLGMHATAVGGCGRDRDVVPGFRRGRPTPPWTFGALEGAGAVRATVADLVTFAGACHRPPDAPIGVALDLARRPLHRRAFGVGGTGLGWMIRTRDRARRRTETVWHDGGTYGASSFIAVDVERSTAVIAVGNAGPRVIPPLDGPAWAVFDDLGI